MRHPAAIISAVVAAGGVVLVALELALRGFWLAAIGAAVALVATAASIVLAATPLLKQLQPSKWAELQTDLHRRLKAFGKEADRRTHDLSAIILYQDPQPYRVDTRGLPLVLISQVPRSGGTLLSQLLDGHPNLLQFPHELKWGGKNDRAWPTVDPSEGPQAVATLLISGNLTNLTRFNLRGYSKTPLVERGYGLKHRWSYWRYVDIFCEEWARRPPESRRDCLDIFMSAFFSAFHDWSDAEREKTAITAFIPGFSLIETWPNNINFFTDYPDGQLISICRNPIDWFASASSYNSRYADPDAALALWAESARAGCTLKDRYGDRVILLTFPSLVEHTREAMTRIAQKIGVPFDEVLLTPTFNGRGIASNSSFASKTGIDRDVLDRSSEVAADVRAGIERKHMQLYRDFAARAEAF